MARFISITKAALFANVQTKDIQEKINCNQLATTRGKIHIDDLLECYPDAKVEQANMISLVEKIKEQSFESGAAKQHGEVTFASLKEDLHKSKMNSEYYRERSTKFEELITYMRENLNDTNETGLSEKRVQRLKQWIDIRLAEIHRNE
jgi:hypothetical protein